MTSLDKYKVPIYVTKNGYEFVCEEDEIVVFSDRFLPICSSLLHQINWLTNVDDHYLECWFHWFSELNGQPKRAIATEVKYAATKYLLALKKGGLLMHLRGIRWAFGWGGNWFRVYNDWVASLEAIILISDKKEVCTWEVLHTKEILEKSLSDKIDSYTLVVKTIFQQNFELGGHIKFDEFDYDYYLESECF